MNNTNNDKERLLTSLRNDIQYHIDNYNNERYLETLKNYKKYLINKLLLLKNKMDNNKSVIKINEVLEMLNYKNSINLCRKKINIIDNIEKTYLTILANYKQVIDSNSNNIDTHYILLSEIKNLCLDCIYYIYDEFEIVQVPRKRNLTK